MKNNIFIILVSAIMLFACTKQNPNQVTITGKVTNPIGETVEFVANDTTYATTLADGAFEISFVIDSAQYISFKQGVETTAMYISPGEEIHLTIDTELFDETITYTGSPASSFLAEKYMLQEKGDFFGEIYYLGTTQEYEDSLNKFLIEVKDKLTAIKDTVFVTSEINQLERTLQYYINRQSKLAKLFENYGDDVRNFFMKKDLLTRESDFYANLTALDFDAFEQALKDYESTLKGYLADVTDEEYVAGQMKEIAATLKHWSERKAMVEAVPKEGEEAIGFTYPDKDGKEYSLSSFEGSLVYVDVWATWCSPCIGEIPSLKKLEEDYHGQKIVFVSISTDSDREAWLKMVEEEGLCGIQLYAGSEWGNDGMKGISRDYAIFGIPRFMLFSKDGKVISSDAPRPSSADIRTLIDKNL